MGSVRFSQAAWEDYLYWQQQNEKTSRRINDLIKNCMRDPYTGIGKPEPLKGNLTGWWSRRITETDRMVYKKEGEVLLIAQLRYHY